MASDKLDMSLEDIIKMNKRGGGTGRNPRYPRGNERGNRGRFNRPRNQEDRLPGVSRGGVQKRDTRNSQYTRPREIPDRWQHDMFEDGGASADRRPVVNKRQSFDDQQATLLISNLHFGVNENDMKELFNEFGTLVKAVVHYDRSGRSLGTAEVIFGRPADALRAKKQYDNVPLDGQPMKITMVGDNNQPQPSRSLADRIGTARVGNRDNQGPSSRPPRRENTGRGGRGGRFNNGPRRGGSGGGGGGGGGGGRRGDRTMPTKEELDAELDAYNAKMETE